MKREIYPRHKAGCPNRKSKHPRRKFDGCRVYARYSIVDPHNGELLEEFNGALPLHIETKDATDSYVNQRFALLLEKHQRGEKVETVNHGVSVKPAAEKYIKDQMRQFPPLEPVQISDNVRRTHERLNIDANHRQHEIVEKIELLIGSRFVQFCEDHKPPIRQIRDVRYEYLTAFLDAQPGRVVLEIVTGVQAKVQKPQSPVTWNKNMELVKRFFCWLHDEVLIQNNPADRLKTIKMQSLKPQIRNSKSPTESCGPLMNLPPEVRQTVKTLFAVR